MEKIIISESDESSPASVADLKILVRVINQHTELLKRLTKIIEDMERILTNR